MELVFGETWHLPRAKKHANICMACKKADSRQWLQANLVKHREQSRRWYWAHRDQERERSRQWKKANPKKHYEHTLRWKRVNPEKHREHSSRWHKAHPSHWAKANPDKHREHSRRHRALKLNATIGPVDEAAIYERDGYMCMYCGATHRKLTIDHIEALNNGGPHCEDNLVVACRRCNSSKHTKPLEDWLQTQPKALAWVM